MGFKVNMTCTSPNYQESIGVWQWVVSTSDLVYSVSTSQYICKYGVGFDKPPQCPLGACADNFCMVCDNW